MTGIPLDAKTPEHIIAESEERDRTIAFMKEQKRYTDWVPVDPRIVTWAREWQRERELADQLAAALSYLEAFPGAPKAHETARAALAQHATMRQKPAG